jgi:acetoin utilization protein AcuC
VPGVSTPASDGPLLVFGPRSPTYDFGPSHPLTPQRFGPGIDLLAAVGAQPGLAPVPATDDELLRVHVPAYVEAVKALSHDPSLPGTMGIGVSDNPAFAGMHEASAAVAGGSLRAMEAVLRGDVEHAHHPGGGLHHAMPARASGFCIYDDPALAVVRARAAGLRVLYVDLDVHHGDGVQAICLADPGVLTLSLHESGRYLFPGTGSIDELGEGSAAGTAVNMPFEPYAGEGAWLAAVRALVPTLAAVFGPDVVVSQHGGDSHAWDPLAHLRVTTTAVAEAARIVDAVAHRWAGGRWLATGGGGYDVYRVVPRAWALTWLAGAHREPPENIPAAWRERWAGAADRFGTPGLPATFLDAPNAGLGIDGAQASAESRSLATLERVRRTVLPRLVREAEDRGWWRPGLRWAGREVAGGAGARRSSPSPAGGTTMTAPGATTVTAPGTRTATPSATPAIRELAPGDADRLRLVPRVVPLFDPADGRALLAAALAGGARVVAAVSGDTIVGVAVCAAAGDRPGDRPGDTSLLATGVAPDLRRRGLGLALVRALAAGLPAGTRLEAQVGVAERDAVDPLPVETRIDVARRLLTAAGFESGRPSPDVTRDDPWAISARLSR